MLISSMDQLNYYSMPKDGYLEIDTSSTGYSMGQQSLGGLMPEEGSPTYMNEENSPKNGTKSSLYKTELCKRFSEFGSCRYGAKCQFAHGIGELRHVVRHPKYKTTKCKSYWGSGHCPYGSRCRFIHEETEGMSQPPFSPPGSMSGMGGMFFQEKNGADSLNSPSGSYLYGGHNGVPNGNGDHVLAGGSYQKDYSLLSSFNQDAVAMPWGSAPSRPQQSPLNYGGNPGGMVPPQVGAAPNGSGYPDLQDAIDALMRFSLSPAEAEAQLRAGGALGAASANGPSVSSAGGGVVSNGNAQLGTISTTPSDSLSAAGAPTIDTSSVSTTAGDQKADYSLESDELWKDFPSLNTSSVGDFGEKHWPTGLSLSLEGTGLFSNSSSGSSTPPNGNGNASAEANSNGNVDTTEPETATTPSKKDETSPRLSIFERFH